MNKAKKVLNIFSETFYSVEGGMKKIGDEKILIQPNTFYYMGASSSPELVYVIDVNDKFISYAKNDYKDVLKIETPIGKNLINKGVDTWLKRADLAIKWNPSLKVRKDKLSSLINGISVEPDGKDYRDFQRMEVQVIPSEKNKNSFDDLWDILSKSYNVLGTRTQEDGSEVYQLIMSKNQLKDFKNNKDYVVVNVVED